MIRRLIWNNGLTTRVGFGFPLFTRGDAAYDDLGVKQLANNPRHGAARLICPAPNLGSAHRSGGGVTNVGNIRVWSGRWNDGVQPCLVEAWTESNTRRIAISVNSYGPVSARIKNIGIPADFAVEAGWRHAPAAFVVCDGLILAVCLATDTADGNPKAVSLCYWDENVSGSNNWLLKRRLPSVQAGQARGRDWIASGPWVPPGGMDANGAILKCIFLFVDYRQNSSDPNVVGSLGGQLIMVAAQRTNAGSLWTLDEPILLYEDSITGPVAGTTEYMHFHNAGLTFHPTAENPNAIVVSLSVGDSPTRNRLITISRDDWTQYRQGTGEPRAATPDTTTVPPAPAAQNGWTTYEDREGQRARITFSDAIYSFSGGQHLLSSAAGAFANYAQPTGGGVTPLLITAGVTPIPQTIGVTGKGGSGALILNRAVADLSPPPPPPPPLTGYLYADNSIQGVPHLPTSDAKTMIFGGDESANAIYKYTVTGAANKIDPAIVHGVMTDSTHGYTTLPDTSAVDRSMGWLALIGSFMPSTPEGVFGVSGYLAHVTPNAFDPWRGESRAQTVMFSSDGALWGDLFAPNHPSALGADLQVPSAIFGNDVFIGRADTAGLYSTPLPKLTGTASRAITARPLQISNGGTNILRTKAGDSTKIDVKNGPDGSNQIRHPTRGGSSVVLSDTNIIESVPLPPCAGPITRFTVADSPYIALLHIGKVAGFAATPRVRVRVWVYRLPSAKATGGAPLGENAMPPSCQVYFGATLGLVPEGESFYGANSHKSRYLSAAAIAGTGWTPVTLHASFETYPSGSTDIYAELYSGVFSFSRQDFLIAWDYVVVSDGTLELPQRPLVVSDPPTLSQKEVLTANCSLPSPSSATWSFFIAFRIPDSGPDPFTQDRAVASAITVCTLRQSASSYLRVVLNRGGSFGSAPIPTNSLSIIDHTGTEWPIEGPASGDDGINIAQPFLFLRGRQVLLGIARYETSGSGGTATASYRAWVSVGGTRVKIADSASGGQIPLKAVTPSTFRTGDVDGNSPDAIEFFGLWMDDANALNAADGKARLESLDWLV